MSRQLSADAANQKLRGGYYTPDPIAQFLARWSVRAETDEVLEPSCGDGILLGAAARRLLTLGASPKDVARQVQGIELYESEAALTCMRLERMGVPNDKAVSVGDFFDLDEHLWGIDGRLFDTVIGNPPFLRYHNFPEEQRKRAFRIMHTAGLNPSRLTNSWVAFLIAASLRLKPDGRLAMVIPAELLQVKYAEETRAFLARHYGAITIITFRRLIFESIQQEVVLLLAEKTPDIESGIDVIELGDAGDLADYEVKLRGRCHLKSIDHAAEKWTKYYLDKDEIALLRETKRHPQLKRIGQLGSIDIGVVTGNNRFFVLNEERLLKLGLAQHALPLVGRTSQLPGLTFTKREWLANRNAGISCHLLNLPDVPFSKLPRAAQNYLRHGEANGVHAGFKCSIRGRWHVVPTLWSPDAFLFRQIHEYPKLVVNRSEATCTDTIHRFRCYNPRFTKQLTLAFLNSLTFAFAEVIGRSYGGGVLELQPNEAELLPIPFFADVDLDLKTFDRFERRREIGMVLQITDKELLKEKLGFDEREIKMFRQIWRKLSARRVARKYKIPKPLPEDASIEPALKHANDSLIQQWL